MKATKYLSAGIATLLAVTSAQTANVVIHVTGSTAFRSATTQAIKNVLGGNAVVKSAYVGSSGGASAATYAVFEGPVGADRITIKCTWTGSVGGIKTVVQNIAIQQTTAPNGWLSRSHVASIGAGVEVPVSSGAIYTLDTAPADFPTETRLADVTMSDSAQSSTGFPTPALVESRVGVVPFEWVANNGSPAALNNITPLQAQALFSGGVPLSQLTLNAADNTVAVYAVGRDFDSGTRLLCLAEVGIPFRGSVQHVQPQITGTAGAAGSSVNALKLWPLATVLGDTFQIGQSGFSGGGALADNLATPGSSTAATPVGADGVQFGPGWLVGYLGRNDASRACKTSVIATNTAHRLTWNGIADWSGAINANGTPTTVVDSVIQEGGYTAWEYEFLSYRQTYAAPAKTVADLIATNLHNTTATLSGILLGSMNVSKPVEGGLVTYGNPF